MTTSTKILINAISQYIRTGLCMAMTLYSTRIILDVLGQSDFGIYSLIGSLVMMGSFITTSLSTSTQRFISVVWGKNDINEVKKVFSNALVLHVLLSLVIAIVLWMAEYAIVHNYLNIAPERLEAADFVYYMVVLILVLTFINAPIRALFIARENIVYASIIEILDGAIKLGGAIGLTWVTIDTLKAYSMLMAFISLFTLLAFLGYALAKYEECHIPQLKEISREYVYRLVGFALWNTYAVGSTVLRTQGLAVIINRFTSTIVNAAYGISLQISLAISSIAGSVINAMNPQLMKAEGSGDRNRMLYFATIESKYSLLVLATLLIPVVVELPDILTFWLKEYPPYTLEFSRIIIISIILDQITIGLTSANQAIGKIRNYSLITSTIRLLTLPVAWISLRCGYNATSVMVVYLAFDILCGASRVPFLKYTAGLHIGRYLKEVALQSIIPIAGCTAICIGMVYTISLPFRFVITELIGITVSVVLIYIFTLSHNEKQWVNNKLLSKIMPRR